MRVKLFSRDRLVVEVDAILGPPRAEGARRCMFFLRRGSHIPVTDGPMDHFLEDDAGVRYQLFIQEQNHGDGLMSGHARLLDAAPAR